MEEEEKEDRENECRDLDGVDPCLEVEHGNLRGECFYSSLPQLYWA